jgi:hypothetical protein
MNPEQMTTKVMMVVLALAAGPAVARAAEQPVMVAARAARGDRACLRTLERRRVLFVALGAGGVKGVHTPVAVVGPVGGVNLLPRAGRPPIMDCALARALGEAGPIFRSLKITGLSFSEAYDYRTRARSRKLSAHAFGMAIDVHGLETGGGELEVERDYPHDGRRWREREAPLAACVGRPAARGGKLLRTLACRLRAHRAFRLILGPDDNADHHDHLHLETSREPPSERLVATRGKDRPSAGAVGEGAGGGERHHQLAQVGGAREGLLHLGQ